jgi:hypothetical protein
MNIGTKFSHILDTNIATSTAVPANKEPIVVKDATGKAVGLLIGDGVTQIKNLQVIGKDDLSTYYTKLEADALLLGKEKAFHRGTQAPDYATREKGDMWLDTTSGLPILNVCDQSKNFYPITFGLPSELKYWQRYPAYSLISFGACIYMAQVAFTYTDSYNVESLLDAGLIRYYGQTSVQYNIDATTADVNEYFNTSSYTDINIIIGTDKTVTLNIGGRSDLGVGGKLEITVRVQGTNPTLIFNNEGTYTQYSGDTSLPTDVSMGDIVKYEFEVLSSGVLTVIQKSVVGKVLTHTHTEYVEKVAGKGLSTNDYTTDEKNKLAGLEGSKYKGRYTDLAALNTAHATATVGDYARVDGGVGSDVVTYLWDDSDNKWVQEQGTGTTETASSVKSKYESNPDTNVFNDADKTKLDGVETNATNWTNAKTIASTLTGWLAAAADATLGSTSTIRAAIEILDWRTKNIDGASITTGTINDSRLSSNIVRTSDSRLTDARTPTAHQHSGADITTGTVADARLSSNVALKNVSNIFTLAQFSNRSLADDTAWFGKVGSEAVERYRISVSGRQEWGDGTNARDTFLYRSAAGILRTEGSFVVGGTIWISATGLSNNATPTNANILLPATGTEVKTSIASNTALKVINTNASPTGNYYEQYVGTETQPRLSIDRDGKHNWGPGGTTAPDTFLDRFATAWLRLTGNLFITGILDVSTIRNATNTNNSQVLLSNTGVEARTAITGNVALKIFNTISTTVTDLTQWIKGSTVVAKVTADGVGDFAGVRVNGTQKFVDQTYMNDAFTLAINNFPEPEKAKLRLSTNWTNGVYTGEPLVNCFHGTTLCERGIDTAYSYYMIEDNFPIRNLRG